MTQFLDALRDVAGDPAFHDFNTRSDEAKLVSVLGYKSWDESCRSSVCNLVKTFLQHLWLSRQSRARALLPHSTSNGAAPSGGAEVYGQLATTSNI